MDFKRKISRVLLLSALSVLTLGVSASAASADIKTFSFNIVAGEWNSFSSGKYSKKYYKGTKANDKSAYVVSTTSNTGITMRHYLQNNSVRKSSNYLHRGTQVRKTYANYGDKNHSSKFWGQRENFYDGLATVKGSWSADDSRK